MHRPKSSFVQAAFREGVRGHWPAVSVQLNALVCLFLTAIMTDTLLNVFLAIAVDNLANAQELTKVWLYSARCKS